MCSVIDMLPGMPDFGVDFAVRASHGRWMKNVRNRTGIKPMLKDSKEWFHHKGWFEPTVETMRYRGMVLLEVNEKSLWQAKYNNDDVWAGECIDFLEYIVAHLKKLGVVVNYDDGLKLN
jgi:hypothetical protein